MPTLAIALAAVLAQGAFACECDQGVAWVSPHGATFPMAESGPGKDEPEKVGASRETFITRIGQDERGYWTMTKEDIHGSRVDDRFATGSAPFRGASEIASPSGVR
jgi:hypothetical protein